MLLFALANNGMDEYLKFTLTLFQSTLYFVYTLVAIGSVVMLHYGVIGAFSIVLCTGMRDI